MREEEVHGYFTADSLAERRTPRAALQATASAAKPMLRTGG